MDFWMKREDYETLQKHADEFKEPYFLQTPYTDKGYYHSAIKFRNSNTTNLSEVFLFEDWNMGISIDIFPIDKYISSELIENYKKIGELTYQLSTYMRISNPYLDEKNKKRVEEYCGRNPLELYEELESIAQQYNNSDKADCYLEIVNTQYKDPFKKVIHEEDLNHCVYLDFENTKIPAYNGYINHLKSFYGDYMQLPPKEKRGLWHDGIYVPEIPFKEYVDKKRKELAED
jgi:lipopolysaccharide cholinephosphotransferase